ncbi:hypothetical protein L3V64_003280 [Geobacillus stearothermophilus]|uniref:hypothetical protein n=1 Tax=Geobacillus stearothermophilus TaxID=1422 RepID=UPI001F34A00B|nr:hypothetical protein [Geobacillus stearothermophilus]MCK7605396.1 hypothetical protein [Geobacillus stearothermophilus]
MDEELIIGKLAYKKRGFFSGLIGIVQENNNGITPYKLVFQSGAAVGIQGKDDIVIVGEEDRKNITGKVNSAPFLRNTNPL